mmetsp:Transcript_42731/g.91676  ORF Transcript_42731/g.91676 Transcript_42731/m.91676 type:complete len:726 (-) Transcript_42731:238-2415(-)|eukprot:CAMPEP_0206439404 /NCGR_PEP_ID=MMETSP0324_2-20121206/12185_1 /ASSEMBLY_ACC=CAM_ASM_000836 /TAXON_ID=2866 /ORGANISM="Crypthecodinium cohnii, Strain Seligo" /LENGTH=725 /DNA_ID=CAMNT_0053907007 /DNA_START=35 /DNA_END=2212 /DNA_ORIENTATION=-
MAHEEEEEEKVDPSEEGAAKKKKAKKKKKKAAGEGGGASPERAEANNEDAVAAGYIPPRPEREEPAEEEWLDISEMCGLAVGAMEAGEMMSSSRFHLFDAMSAIEIMDPKMDTGYKGDEDMTLERAEKEGIIKKSLPERELLAIWDRLLMYYMLWMEGHTIVQTIWCCLYLHNLEEYVKPIPSLAAFTDVFLLACRFANKSVFAANIFDDEDYMPMLFDIDLQQCVTNSTAEEVTAAVREEQQKLSQSNSIIANSLVKRLDFILEYALAITELGSTKPNGEKRNVAQALESIERCSEALSSWEKEALPEAPENAFACFDHSISRKLLVPGPPRTVKPVEDTKAVLGMWKTHLEDLKLACSVSKLSLPALVDGVFSDTRRDPNILARSIAHSLSMESGFLGRLIMTTLEDFMLPPDAKQHCEEVKDLVTTGGAMVAHLLRLSHASRARKFRRLAHVFTDLNTLQHQSWQLDEQLRGIFASNMKYPRPTWLWIMELSLGCMVSKLMLGFELELYDIGEYHMIYWYTDYLCGLRNYNLNELYVAKEQPIGDKKKARRPQPDRKGQKPRAPPAHLIFSEAFQTTIRGLFRLLSFCSGRGLLAAPGAVGDLLEQRFVLRFRSLENFRLPHLPTFQDFKASSKCAEAPGVLEAAQMSFTEAMQASDKLIKEHTGRWAEQAQSLKRIIVANRLAIVQISRAIEADGGSKLKGKITATNAYHPHLVAVQIPKD